MGDALAQSGDHAAVLGNVRNGRIVGGISAEVRRRSAVDKAVEVVLLADAQLELSLIQAERSGGGTDPNGAIGAESAALAGYHRFPRSPRCDNAFGVHGCYARVSGGINRFVCVAVCNQRSRKDLSDAELDVCFGKRKRKKRRRRFGIVNALSGPSAAGKACAVSLHDGNIFNGQFSVAVRVPARRKGFGRAGCQRVL